MGSYDYENAVTLLQDCFKRIAAKRILYWTLPNDTSVEAAINSLIDEIINRIEENKKIKDNQLKEYEEKANKETIIISGFPACGKTYLYLKSKSTKTKVLDSNSGKYSWIYGTTKVRNPDFPNNYINHIKENIGKVDYILVSSHEVVRQALKKEKIPYILVYPNKSLLNEWIGRCYLRENDKQFIDNLIQNWDLWIDNCKCDDTVLHFELGHGQYLSDVIIIH